MVLLKGESTGEFCEKEMCLDSSLPLFHCSTMETTGKAKFCAAIFYGEDETRCHTYKLQLCYRKESIEGD